MRKTLVAVAAAFALVIVAPPAEAASASISQVTNAAHSMVKAAPLYKCKKWNWFIGWRTIYTSDIGYVVSLMNSGWTCYCVNGY